MKFKINGRNQDIKIPLGYRVVAKDSLTEIGDLCYHETQRGFYNIDGVGEWVSDYHLVIRHKTYEIANKFSENIYQILEDNFVGYTSTLTQCRVRNEIKQKIVNFLIENKI